MEMSVRNASQALCEGLRRIMISGVKRESRAGRVLEFNEPVIIRYADPQERIIFFRERDFPSIFVLMESIWMMAGRNDVKWLSKFNARMKDYSDDGETFHGAYGYRWRKAFDSDQLERIIQLLKNRPETRRAVIQMWHSEFDLHPDESEHKDIPCNMLVKFQKRQDSLDMSVFNRSNDLVWGATGANSVHFSVLHEYVAQSVGMPVGRYYQISDNLHVYEEIYNKYRVLASYAPDGYRRVPVCAYAAKSVKPYQIVTYPGFFLEECERFCREEETEFTGKGYKNSFFDQVAKPMAMVYREWKSDKPVLPGKYVRARKHIENMPDCDWKVACENWLSIREDKAKK